jgi:hypothetical protein
MLADTASTAISITILVGVLIAFVGELTGVIRNAHSPSAHGLETITDYVRWIVRHSLAARIAVGVFTLSLFWHFLFNGPLLP